MKKPLKRHYIEEGEILLVHKPLGITSFDLVAKMRKILDTRKIGHAGTLDPLASGLMILGVNKGTKKMKNYVGMDKEYIAEIIIGCSTTTGDREGGITEEKIPYKNDISEKECEEALRSLYGEKYYPAPRYSAVKVLGKALYKYAREGKEPPFIPEKKMHLKNAYITDRYKKKDFYIVKIRARVGSGTYIRTLAEEFGKKLGYPASLKSLYRVSIDKYLDKDAFHINSAEKKSLRDILNVYPVIKKVLCKSFFKQKK